MARMNGSQAQPLIEQAAAKPSGDLEKLLARPVGQIDIRDGQVVPADFEGIQRMSKWLMEAGCAPESVKGIGQCMAIIGYGMSIGLSALASLRSIMLVRGIPTIWGDAALALVRRSPLCGGVREWMEAGADADSQRANCECKRWTKQPDGAFREETIVYSFSVADAKKAGLWGKTGPWTQHPKRMLKYRARAFCLRDAFPDVLNGLYITEEIDDGEPSRKSALDEQVMDLPEPTTTADAEQSVEQSSASEPEVPPASDVDEQQTFLDSLEPKPKK